MRYLLSLALLGTCLPLAAAEYGSATLAYLETPEASLQRYARLLCAKVASRPAQTSRLGDEQGYLHIVCKQAEQKTGHVFARYGEGRLYINYRVD